jgi:hypothetical protein
MTHRRSLVPTTPASPATGTTATAAMMTCACATLAEQITTAAHNPMLAFFIMVMSQYDVNI